MADGGVNEKSAKLLQVDARGNRTRVTVAMAAFCRPQVASTAKTLSPDVAVGTRVTLTRPQVESCLRIAAARYEQNIRGHVHNRRYSRRDDLSITCQGVVGEMACCTLFGLPTEDLDDTRCRSAATETKFDGTLDQWIKFDVKCTFAADAPLHVPTWKIHNRPHAYILLLFDNPELAALRGDWAAHFRDPAAPLPTLWFAGLMAASHVFQPAHLVTSYQDKRRHYYQVPQSQLYTLGHLRECLGLGLGLVPSSSPPAQKKEN